MHSAAPRLDIRAFECGGSKMGIDATRKLPGDGLARAWPPELEMLAEIKELVTQRWGEHGL